MENLIKMDPNQTSKFIIKMAVVLTVVMVATIVLLSKTENIENRQTALEARIMQLEAK